MAKVNSFVCLFLFLLFKHSKWILPQLLKTNFWGTWNHNSKDESFILDD